MVFNFYKYFSVFLIVLSTFLLNSCGGGIKLPGGDARKNPPDPNQRVANNIEQGKGYRLSDIGKNNGGGNFEFASSNELWRASLDVIDFMPLTSANYSVGILITDQYSDGGNGNESIKINIRFLSNEIRSDALDINVFYKTCKINNECTIEKKNGELQQELTKEILRIATLYKTQKDNENFKPYTPNNFKKKK